MGLRKLNNLLFLLLFPFLLNAQVKEDSVRSSGKLSGEWRTFYMATVNKGDLKNFQALATGGYLKYEHTFRKRFVLGGALYTSFNLNIQDLEDPDPVTGRYSRYESGLFDVTDLSDRAIFVLGELYAGYQWKNGNVRIGRMRTKTPFVNGQDGRMIPTMIQGVQVYQKIRNNLNIRFGIYNEIAPRSTEGFFGIGESIGKYPVGRDMDGNPSGYAGNTKSDFMTITDINWQPAKGFNFRVVDYFIDNVFHTIYFHPSYTLSSGERSYTFEGEWLHQDRINDGGNAEGELRYFTDAASNVFGIRLSTRKKARWYTAYNRITDDGRFLFPREWGREFLFTFQKRERSEGIRDGHNLLLGVSRPFSFSDHKLNTDFSIGKHWNPSVTEAANNKYAMPDYVHMNLDMAYEHKKLPRLRSELLVTYKVSREDLAEKPNLQLNKVDMWHFSVVLNYRF